jgi:hypothetical protein
MAVAPATKKQRERHTRKRNRREKKTARRQVASNRHRKGVGKENCHWFAAEIPATSEKSGMRRGRSDIKITLTLSHIIPKPFPFLFVFLHGIKNRGNNRDNHGATRAPARRKSKHDGIRTTV